MQLSPAEPQGEQEPTLGQNHTMTGCRSTPAAARAIIEFGRFRILLRRRALLADGAPVKLGTRAFDLLMVLIEAEGSLVTKADLLNRVWQGIIVTEDNLKMQISELRGVLAGDRDLIQTEFGRGYRFTGVVRRSTIGDPEASPAFAATGEASGPNGNAPTDLAALAARLTSLEAKLAEMREILAREPRTGHEFRHHRSCAELSSRRTRSRRQIDSAFAVGGGRPRKIADWAGGG